MKYLNVVLILFTIAAMNNCNNDILPISHLESLTDSISPGYGTTKINLTLTRQQIEKNVNTIASSGYDYGKYFADNCTTEVLYNTGKPTILIFRSGKIRTSENITFGSTHNEVYKAYGVSDSTSYESKVTYTIHFKKPGISFSFDAIQKIVIDINITKSDTTASSVIGKSIILGEPADTTVETGKRASFSIKVPESHLYDGFQWQKNGVNIPSAIFTEYTTSPVQALDNGATYRCIVSNPYGSDTSRSAVLHVIAIGNSTLDTVFSGYGTKDINLEMSKQQIEAVAQKIPNPTIDEYIFLGCSLYVAYSENMPRGIEYLSNVITDKGIKIGSPDSLVISYYGNPDTTINGSKYCQLYYKKSGIIFVFLLNKTQVFHICVMPPVKNAAAPVITTQPVNISVNAGDVASFSITSTGDNLTYQWKRNGVTAGTNANTYTYTTTQNNNQDSIRCIVSNSQGSDTSKSAILHINTTENYTLDTIIPGYGTKNVNLEMSKQQIETVAQKIQNSNYDEYVFRACSLYVMYNGNTPSGIVYRSNVVTNKNVKIGSSHSSVISNYGTPDTTNNGTASFQLVYKKSGIIFIFLQNSTQVLQIAIMPPVNNPASPIIANQPANISVIAGETATFSITATGDNLSYQWKRNGTSVGSNTNTHSYTVTQSNSNDSIWCIVSNTGGSITSLKAKLTVTTTPPSITIQPVNVTVSEGSAATFTVSASGISLQYQWKWNGISIGTNSSSYSFFTTLSNNSDSIWCIVSNAGGTVSSNRVQLIVNKKVISWKIITASFSNESDLDYDGFVLHYSLNVNVNTNGEVASIYFKVYKQAQNDVWGLFCTKYMSISGTGSNQIGFFGGGTHNYYNYRIEMYNKSDDQLLDTVELNNHMEETISEDL